MLYHVMAHPEVAGVRALACCLLAQASLSPKWHLKMWDRISAVAAQWDCCRLHLMALSMTVMLRLIRRARFAGKGFAEEQGLAKAI
jgi:hypothetical protein